MKGKELTEPIDVDGCLRRLVQSKDLKVVGMKEGEDAFSLTDLGLVNAQKLINEMIAPYDAVKKKETMPKELGNLLERHGICAIASFGLELAPIEGKREPYFWELRFRFMGGNKELCRTAGSVQNRTSEAKN